MAGVTTIAYADDRVMIVVAKDARKLVFKTNESLEVITEWTNET